MLPSLKISVIVTACNVGKYLRECVESIINQTIIKNDNQAILNNNTIKVQVEIVLVYLPSQDDTEQVAKKLAEEYDIIKLIEAKDVGMSGARNLALDEIDAGAGADLVTFVDAKDWVEPDYLQVLLGGMRNTVLCVCAYDRIKKNEETGDVISRREEIASFRSVERDDILSEIMCNNTIGGYLWNKMFLFEVIADNNLRFDEDLSVGEDMTFVVKYLTTVRDMSKITYRKNVMYHNRVRTDEEMQKKYIAQDFDVKKLTCLESAARISTMCKNEVEFVKAAADYRVVKNSLWAFLNMIKYGYYDNDVLIRINTDLSVYKRIDNYIDNENASSKGRKLAKMLLKNPRYAYRYARIGVLFAPKSKLNEYINL